MEYGIETKCIHTSHNGEQVFGSVSFPIFQTSTFAHPGLGKSTGYDYSRSGNPTRNRLEEIVASLENGTDAFSYSSGMAAITAVMELFRIGDHIIIEEDLYGGSVRLFDTINKKNGIEFTSADLSNADVSSLFRENTKAVFLETPTNPMMHVIDIEKIARISHENNCILIVDNTFLSPYLQNPLELGADIVVHSGSKYLSGHNDTLAGFAVTRSGEIAERLKMISMTTGGCLAPIDSWLVIRGIQTLAVRVEAAQNNARFIASALRAHPKVVKVYYPGFEDHPGYDIMKRQARGFGAMISFQVDSKETAVKLLENTKLIQFAESLGGTESLITYPITQTHAAVPPELLEKNGITPTLLRLSVGIESLNDLIDDLLQALD